jgi:opacity protein-like surface antigen
MRTRYLVAVMIMFLLPLTVFAQVKIGFGPHVGISFSSLGGAAAGGVKPSEIYGMGFNFGAQGEVEVMKYIGIRLGLDYGIFSPDKTKLNFAEGVSGLSVGVFSIMVSGIGKLPLKGGFTPYGILGFGLHMSSASDVTYSGQVVYKAPAGTTDFGMNFGAGAEYRVTKNIGIFSEFKMILVFSSGSSSSMFPFQFGANFWL